MGIITEHQVAIACDNCGDTWVNSHITQKEAMKEARREGWVIGRYVTCPECVIEKTS